MSVCYSSLHHHSNRGCPLTFCRLIRGVGADYYSIFCMFVIIESSMHYVMDPSFVLILCTHM